MLAAAERVEAVECAHSLEAEVRELRLIAAHKPPYNRRSKFPERVVWLKLTDEAYPRLSRGPRRWPTTARPTSGRSPPGGRPSWPRPASTTRCRCASARRKLSTRTTRRRPARWPSWAGARRPASTGSPRRSTRHGPPRRSATATTGDPRPWSDALLARIDVLADAAALRGGGR